MNVDDIVYLYSVNNRVLHLNCEEISEEESLISTNGSSSINWIVGHGLRSRSDVLELADEERIHALDDYMWYRPTHESAIREGEPLLLQTLLAEWRATHEQFIAAIRSAWTRAENEENAAARKNLLFYAFHESYHVGQLGICRRMVGKAGKIP
jgi:uncharacterized damage-inducible protein DinB